MNHISKRCLAYQTTDISFFGPCSKIRSKSDCDHRKYWLSDINKNKWINNEEKTNKMEIEPKNDDTENDKNRYLWLHHLLSERESRAEQTEKDQRHHLHPGFHFRLHCSCWLKISTFTFKLVSTFTFILVENFHFHLHVD